MSRTVPLKYNQMDSFKLRFIIIIIMLVALLFMQSSQALYIYIYIVKLYYYHYKVKERWIRSEFIRNLGGLHEGTRKG